MLQPGGTLAVWGELDYARSLDQHHIILSSARVTFRISHGLGIDRVCATICSCIHVPTCLQATACPALQACLGGHRTLLPLWRRCSTRCRSFTQGCWEDIGIHRWVSVQGEACWNGKSGAAWWTYQRAAACLQGRHCAHGRFSPMCSGPYHMPEANAPFCRLLPDEQRWHVLNHYRGLEPGPEHFGLVQRAELSMHKDLSIDALVSGSCPCCRLHMLCTLTDHCAAFHLGRLFTLGSSACRPPAAPTTASQCPECLLLSFLCRAAAGLHQQLELPCCLPQATPAGARPAAGLQAAVAGSAAIGHRWHCCRQQCGASGAARVARVPHSGQAACAAGRLMPHAARICGAKRCACAALMYI